MNHYVHRMLGHYLQDAAEEGADLGSQAAEQDDQAEQDEGGDDQAQDDEPELVITLGGEQPDEQEQEAQRAPQWVKDLRKRVREQEREIRELRSKGQQNEQPKAPEVGPEPELEDDDIDYDGAKFKAKHAAWLERKRQADAFVAEQQQAVQRQQDEWQAKLTGYADQRAQLKLPDYDDAEAIAAESLSQTQQAIIISGADKPAHLIYAIGKNPAKVKELAAITDPVKFAFAVAKLETQMKVESKVKKPAPERVVTGNAPVSVGSDATLERLREEAAKTGDMTKVLQYKRQQKAKHRG